MSEESSSELLTNRQPVTIVLRLVVDARGNVIHGELLDDDGEPVRHFLGWRGMARTLHQWIDQTLRARAAAIAPQRRPVRSSVA